MRKHFFYQVALWGVVLFAGGLSASAQNSIKDGEKHRGESYSICTDSKDALPLKATFSAWNGLFFKNTRTLFTEGTPVTSARVNLENLFANVPRFLKNASDFKMQSFEYVGKAKSRRSIRRLIKKSYQDVRAWEIKTEISKRNDTLTQVNISMKRDPWQLKADTVTTTVTAAHHYGDVYDFGVQVGKIVKQIEQMLPDAFSYLPKIGDEIWRVCFTYQDKAYTSFVFIDPEDFRVRYGAPWLFSLAEEFFEWRK